MGDHEARNEVSTAVGKLRDRTRRKSTARKTCSAISLSPVPPVTAADSSMMGI